MFDILFASFISMTRWNFSNFNLSSLKKASEFIKFYPLMVDSRNFSMLCMKASWIEHKKKQVDHMNICWDMIFSRFLRWLFWQFWTQAPIFLVEHRFVTQFRNMLYNFRFWIQIWYPFYFTTYFWKHTSEIIRKMTHFRVYQQIPRKLTGYIFPFQDML